MQNDDVGALLQRLEGLDFPVGRLVVVDFLEGDYEGIGEAAGLIDVRIRARAHALVDFVLAGYFPARVNAPALRRRVCVHIGEGG